MARGLSEGENVLNRSSRILLGLLLIPLQTVYQREQYAVFVSEDAKTVPDSALASILGGIYL